MTKKTALIILIITIVGSIFFVLYSIFFSGKDELNNNPDNKNRFGSFFPTSKEETEIDTNSQITNSNTGQQNTQNNTISKLRKITDVPVSGSIIYNATSTRSVIEEGIEKKEEFVETFIRFVEKSTGNVYETKTTSNSIERVTNTSIPKSYNSVFDLSGKNLIITTYEGFKTNFVSQIKDRGFGEITTLDGYFLPSDADNVSLFGNNISYSLIENSQKYGEVFALYTTKNEQGSTPKRIFSSPIKNWEAEQINDNLYDAFTKPSYFNPGFLYEVTSNGVAKKILDSINGLNLISNTDYVFYSTSRNESIENFIYDRKSKQTVSNFLKTLPNEKCVFSQINKNILYCAVPKDINNSVLPDEWYLGQISFSDLIYKIDLKENLVDSIALDEMNGQEIDIYKISVSPDEKFLVFINKKDLSLWSLEI